MKNRNVNVNRLLMLAFLATLVFASQAYLSANKHSTTRNANNSQLIISLNKNTYLESEPIWVDVAVHLDKTQKLERKPILEPSNDMQIILRNSKGETIEYIGGISEVILQGKKYPDTLF